MKIRVAVLSVVALLFSAPGLASDLFDAKDPKRVMELAKGFGSAELGTDSDGDPKITGRIDGTRYVVLFFGCENGRNCTDIQFRAGWVGNDRFSADDMNRWNRAKRFGKAYLDGDNDPILEMTVNINYGVSRKNLEDTIDWWQVALRAFKKEVLNED